MPGNTHPGPVEIAEPGTVVVTPAHLSEFLPSEAPTPSRAPRYRPTSRTSSVLSHHTSATPSSSLNHCAASTARSAIYGPSGAPIPHTKQCDTQRAAIYSDLPQRRYQQAVPHSALQQRRRHLSSSITLDIIIVRKRSLNQSYY
ncbi:uncharacterized protein LOC121467373 [Drosophila elegans]|uniref:uncharacterized protein LOC121467373 n=1 Tax=Drosophila elegans TaxID=30023 RepID=UPI001BC8678D|nr:uncharacterized protein LOC121467373 [Drosophila elegans]